MAKGKGEVAGWITRNGVHVPIYGNYTVRGGEEPKAKGSKFKGAGKKRKKPDLNAIKSYASDPRTATGDPTVIKVGDEEYFKSGENRWEKHSVSGRVLSSSISDEKMNDIVQKHDGDITVLEGKQAKNAATKGKQVEGKKVDTSTTSGKTANDLNSNLKKKGLELDSADLSSMAHKDFNDEKVTMYDKDGNTYEGTYNKYKNGDREIVDIKKTGGRDTGKSEVSKGHTEEGKGAIKDVEGKKPVTQAEEENRPKNFKEGLKQHEGIQQIAEAQNKKVWNGGASNQELYDAADRFSESKNFNKDKVRDAAFSAFNEKWVATQKERAAQKEQESSKVDRKQDAIDYIAKREDVHPSVAKDTYEHMSESERNHVANEAYKRKQAEQKSSKSAATPTISPKTQKVADNAKNAQTGSAQPKPRPTNFKEGLKQHPDIQRIAEEQNNKVWNGGATNKELYDAADRFSESKNFNKDKVRDAAFSAFNEKWWATNKAKQAQKENASSQFKGENTKEAKGSIPTTVSGLKSAYAEATGSEKAAIASELRRKGYSLIGGKWIKA